MNDWCIAANGMNRGVNVNYGTRFFDLISPSDVDTVSEKGASWMDFCESLKATRIDALVYKRLHLSERDV